VGEMEGKREGGRGVGKERYKAGKGADYISRYIKYNTMKFNAVQCLHKALITLTFGSLFKHDSLHAFGTSFSVRLD
jgi:hypothetical protein